MGALTRWLGLDAAAAAASYPGPTPIPIASPWADPDALTVATWAGLFDLPDVVLPTTRAQAISLPSVAKGRDLIAVSVARMALAACNADGRLAQQPRIVERPELGRSRFTTLTWTVDDLIFHGFSVWEVTARYAEDQRPRIARRVPMDRIETAAETGEVVSVFGRPISDQREIIRFDGPHEGILTRAAEVIRATRRLFLDYARATGMPTPDVELHQVAGDPMDDGEIDKLIARWAAARRGENGRVAYTNASIQAIMHGQQPENLLVEARKAADLDLARHMGLPAWAVDAEVGGSSLTYSNVPQRSRELIDYTLAGYMEAIAGRLSLDDVLAAGIWAEFSTDVLTNGDFADRMTAGKQAIDAGIYTAEEIRAREPGQPVEGATPA